MAKIPEGTFRNWQDTEVINATEYKRERELIKVAVNDNDERLSSLEESTSAIQLDTAQLSKITNNEGSVKLSLRSTNDDILSELLKLGKGMHTFYAVSGSKNLPPTNISIRGIAHFTDTAIGWVWATDYRNNIFTNYYDSGSWKGWKALIGYSTDADKVATALNNMKDTGFFYVNPNTANAPNNHAGHLIVSSLNPFKVFIAQMFIDMDTASVYTRVSVGANGAWGAWNRMVSDNDTQDQLWTNTTGYYMHAGQTVTPTKKLSQCRNGWILVWSDYNTGGGANNVDINYSYIPKGSPFKSGHQHFFMVPTFQSDTTVVHTIKRLTVYDDRLVGNVNNDKAAIGANDVVLRSILEW